MKFTKDELKVYEIVEKGLLGEGLTDKEMTKLYATDPYSREAAYIRWAGGQLQRLLADNTAEIHAQIGMNSAPCGKNCKFCSFAACNGLRKEAFDLSVEEVVECAKLYMDQGVNLILLLATGGYKFEKILERVSAVRAAIGNDMPLLVNVEDMSLERCEQVKAAGANGAYHAVRMREGEDTTIPEKERLKTIKNLKKAGMSLQTCVEPVGPEHTPKELTYYSRLCMESHATSAGVGRRVTVPGTMVDDRGMITDVENARNVAVYRLAAGKYHQPVLNCAMATSLSAAAGANLCWAEMGTNPRDTKSRTQDGGRGTNVALNRRLLDAAGWEIKKGPSQGWIL